MRGRALEASARGKAPGASVRDPAGRKRGARVCGTVNKEKPSDRVLCSPAWRVKRRIPRLPIRSEPQELSAGGRALVSGRVLYHLAAKSAGAGDIVAQHVGVGPHRHALGPDCA